jgi:hypothetical protein
MMKKNMGSQDMARKKNKMPAFLAKKKINPKSTAPAKNTKSYSKSKAKGGKDQASEQDEKPHDTPVERPSNRADYAIQELVKPRQDWNKKKGA